MGSDHDSPRPPVAGQSAHTAAQMVAAHRESITHPVWWRSASERAQGIEGEFGRVLRQLLAHVDLAWQPVATLHIASEAIAKGKAVDARVTKLVAFVLRDFVGAFRRCAFAASVLVPGTTAPTNGVPLMDEAADAADSFDRYLNVLQLAAADPAIPEALAETIRTAADALADWPPEFAVLGTACAAEHDVAARLAPMLPPQSIPAVRQAVTMGRGLARAIDPDRDRERGGPSL